MKRMISLALVAVMALTLLAACGKDDSKGNASGGTTEVTLLIGKPEIAAEIENMIKDYNKLQNKAKITIISLGESNAFEKMTTLYSSKNAPTIMMMGNEFEQFKDKLVDLTDQEWVSHAFEGTLDFITRDNKVYGMPLTVEAFGYLYNQAVLDKAVGGTFDPASVQTRDQLEQLFTKVDALEETKGAVHISPMDWSLGAHLTNIMFTNQSQDRDQRHKFLKDLQAGSVTLADNATYNNWLDTVDLMIKYNSEKAAPLSPQYDDGPLALTSGKVGLWFMGNWAYPQIKEADPEGTYGIMPMPISNDPADAGNSRISIGVPSYWSIDKEQSTLEQQAAAKDFLKWLVTDEKGQDYYVNKLNLIPVFDNFNVQMSDNMSTQIVNYMKDKKSLEWMNMYYPTAGHPSMGASLQKYLGGQTDRAGLTTEMQNEWKTFK